MITGALGRAGGVRLRSVTGWSDLGGLMDFRSSSDGSTPGTRKQRMNDTGESDV